MSEYITNTDPTKVRLYERLVRCHDCVNWKTPLAFTATGRCVHQDHKGQITNRNYFCADGKEKDG